MSNPALQAIADESDCDRHLGPCTVPYWMSELWEKERREDEERERRRGGPHLEITPVSPHIQSIMNEMCRPRVTLTIMPPFSDVTWGEFRVIYWQGVKAMGHWATIKLVCRGVWSAIRKRF